MPARVGPLATAPWWFGLGFGLIILAGALLRFAYNEITVNATAIQADAASYVQYAENLLNHGVFSKQRGTDQPAPDSFWAPGYPAFLAGLIYTADTLGADPYRLILAAQVMLGIFTVYFTGLLACRLLPPLWALLAPLLVALSPHLVAVGQNLLTESLFALLLIAALHWMVEGVWRNSPVRFAVAGICLALAWLVNPVSLLLAPLLAVILAWHYRRWGQWPASPLALTLAVLIPLLLATTAWSLRNQAVVSPQQPTSADRLLTNLVIGMHSDFYAIWRADKRDPNNPADLDRKAIGGDYGRFLQVWAARVKADPGGMLHWYLLQKPRLLWGWEVQIGYRDIYIYPVRYSLYHVSPAAQASYHLMRFLHGPLLLLGLLGTGWALAARQGPALLMVAATLVYISLVYIATQADPRYSFPLRAPLYLVASAGLHAAWRRLHGPR